MNFDRPKENGGDESEQNRLPKEETPDVLQKQESKKQVTLASPVEVVEQRLERPTKEKELELAIRGAQDMRNLNDILLKAGGLQGSQKFYPAEDLIRLISKVEQGKESPAVLTGTSGFREKVVNLLRTQKLRESLAADPREVLKKKIADLNFSIDDKRMQLQHANAAERAEITQKIAERERQKAELEKQFGEQN